MRSKNNKDKDEMLLEAEYLSVYKYALALCRSETEAEDITQETFLKAMKKIDSFEGKSGLYTWLCAIAKKGLISRGKGEEKLLEKTAKSFG